MSNPRRPFDSSRTRVGPVFNALAAASGADAQWPRRLLDLAAGTGTNPWHDADLWVLARHHDPAPETTGRKELGLAPPVSLLHWLVANGAVPMKGGFGKGDTGTFRRELAQRVPSRVAEALTELETVPVPPRAWYVLEGYTYPDVVLETPDALIVIEGKRTESGPTTSTTWMPIRDQMLRHLDAAWEIRGGRAVYGLYIVEASPGTTDVPPHWMDAVRRTRSEEMLAASLPHRSEAERNALGDAVVGVTTWQQVVADFGLSDSVLA